MFNFASSITKILKSRQGFTMIQGVIMSGVVMASSLVMTKLFMNQKKTQRSFETRDQIEDITSIIRETLSDKEKCGNTIIQNGLQAQVINASDILELSGIYNDTQSATLTPLISTGENYLSNNVQIKSITLEQADSYVRELVILFERHSENENANLRTKRGVGAKHIKKRIPLRFQFDSSGVFDACYAIVEEKMDADGTESLDRDGIDLPKEFCQDMIENSSGQSALKWYDDRGKCLPNTECSNAGEIFVGISANGSVICKNMLEHVDFSRWVDTTPTSDCEEGSTVELTKTNEKVKIECTAPETGEIFTSTPSFTINNTQTMTEDSPTTFSFVVNNAVSNVDCSSFITVTSSETNLIAEGNITVSGSTPNCTITVNPESGMTGSADLTITATDLNYSASTSVSIQVDPLIKTIAQFSGYRAWSDGTFAKHCYEYINPSDDSYEYSGETGDGVYRIDVDGSGSLTPVNVYCDMTTDGGGWTAFQKRRSNAVNFYQGWNSYVNGFGDFGDQYWLGLDRLRALTANPQKLIIDLTRSNNTVRYANYRYFQIADGPSYTLTVQNYSGTAGDSLTVHSGMRFSTYDKDQDTGASNCAQKYRGAWWYSACHQSNLNGAYGSTTYATGVNWKAWTGYYESLARTVMKIRPINIEVHLSQYNGLASRRSSFVDCGADKSLLDEKISECASLNEGATVNAGGKSWKMVTRVNAKELWLDVESGLIWSANRGTMSWLSALSHCSSLSDYNISGVSWYLPSKEEVTTARGHHYGMVIEDPSSYYWSSTAYSSNSRWRMRWTDGNWRYSNAGTPDYVRCVFPSEDPPETPSSVSVASSSGEDTTPSVLVGGVSSGDTVEIFSDSQCTISMGSAVSSGSTVEVTSSELSGYTTHNFYAKASNLFGASSCSLASTTYDLEEPQIVVYPPVSLATYNANKSSFVDCGASQTTLEDKIYECSHTNNGATVDIGGKIWKMVVRDGTKEVWLDDTTGFVWSPYQGSKKWADAYNHCSGLDIYGIDTWYLPAKWQLSIARSNYYGYFISRLGYFYWSSSSTPSRGKYGLLWSTNKWSSLNAKQFSNRVHCVFPSR